MSTQRIFCNFIEDSFIHQDLWLVNTCSFWMAFTAMVSSWQPWSSGQRKYSATRESKFGKSPHRYYSLLCFFNIPWWSTIFRCVLPERDFDETNTITLENWTTPLLQSVLVDQTSCNQLTIIHTDLSLNNLRRRPCRGTNGSCVACARLVKLTAAGHACWQSGYSMHSM